MKAMQLQLFHCNGKIRSWRYVRNMHTLKRLKSRFHEGDTKFYMKTIREIIGNKKARSGEASGQGKSNKI